MSHRARGAFVLAGLALAAALLGAAPLRRAATPAKLANGQGRMIAERSCLMCHSATLVTQQRKDSTGWEKSVVQMEKWGVKLSPEERASLLRYLRRSYGARTTR